MEKETKGKIVFYYNLLHLLVYLIQKRVNQVINVYCCSNLIKYYSGIKLSINYKVTQTIYTLMINIKIPISVLLRNLCNWSPNTSLIKSLINLNNKIIQGTVYKLHSLTLYQIPNVEQ